MLEGEWKHADLHHASRSLNKLAAQRRHRQRCTSSINVPLVFVFHLHFIYYSFNYIYYIIICNVTLRFDDVTPITCMNFFPFRKVSQLEVLDVLFPLKRSQHAVSVRRYS